eukprot:729490_1
MELNTRILDDIYDGLDELFNTPRSNYFDVCRALELGHNSRVNSITGYSPNDMMNGSNRIPNALDFEFKFHKAKELKHDEYIRGNVVDYKAFMNLIRKQRK